MNIVRVVPSVTDYERLSEHNRVLLINLEVMESRSQTRISPRHTIMRLPSAIGWISLKWTLCVRTGKDYTHYIQKSVPSASVEYFEYP